MDLNTVTEVVSPAGVGQWRPGDAWLAGGTALFAQHESRVIRLLDLVAAGWPPLTVRPDGLEIAATCTIAQLGAFPGAPGWDAWHHLARRCCEAFLASFKIWNAATVGGNICMSLPAGPMVTLATALEARYTLLPRDGASREVAAIDFVTGNHANVLQPGEL